GAGHQSGGHAQVVLADDVGAAALRVRADRLAIRRHDDRDQDRDRDADRNRVAERDGAGQNQDQQDFFGGVCDGGERVGGEDRERRRLRGPFGAGRRGG